MVCVITITPRSSREKIVLINAREYTQKVLLRSYVLIGRHADHYTREFL